MMDLFRAYMTNSVQVGKEERLVEESKKLLFINQMLIFIAHATITHYVAKRVAPSLSEIFVH